MLKWILGAVGVFVVAGLCLFWWLLAGASGVPDEAPGVFSLDDWRARVAGDETAERPTAINVIEVGRDAAPLFAAVAGRFGDTWHTSYNAVQIVTPDGVLIVGGALDRKTSEGMVQDEAVWAFDDAAYKQLASAMLSADQVLMTHEHLDHVMAIARHPEPDALAPRLRLNAPQIADLPLFADGELAPALTSLTPRLDGTVQKIAPGVVVIPAAGHTQGSQLVFVTLQDGREYLLIGDIVWSMTALETLTQRPVLTQYMVFRPKYEDRDAIALQIRAIHDMMAANPDLIVFPSHDRVWLQQLADEGKIGWGFQ